MNPTLVKRVLPNVVMLSLACFAYYQAESFAVGNENGGVGPDLWPKIVCVVLALTSALGILGAFFAVDVPPNGEPGEAAEALPAVPETHPWLVWIGVAAIGLYVGALPTLGFLCATTIFATALLVIGGMRRWALVPIVGVVLAIAFTIIFMKIVYVALPLGEGPFKEVSLLAFRLLGIH
jgi:putative tricarboxylic transport membrane protein